jgi:hypothetical protein
VSCDARLPHVFDAFLLDQSTKSVERASSFESANLLLVLAFEEQLDFRVGSGRGSIAVHVFRVRCWLTSDIWSSTWTAFGLRRRCDLVYRLTGDCGRTMDVFLDSLVSSLYRRALERWTRGKVGHCGSVDCELLARSDPVRGVARI